MALPGAPGPPAAVWTLLFTLVWRAAMLASPAWDPVQHGYQTETEVAQALGPVQHGWPAAFCRTRLLAGLIKIEMFHTEALVKHGFYKSSLGYWKRNEKLFFHQSSTSGLSLGLRKWERMAVGLCRSVSSFPPCHHIGAREGHLAG